MSISALGGVGEIGKNMYVVKYGDDIVVIDSGLKFPEEDMLGIDLVIPDITYLEENKEKVRGILLTHGHEDHIGGLAFVLKRMNVPVYGTRLTLGLVENKLREVGILQDCRLHVIDSESEIILGNLPVSFFKTNHSIPDSVGICIHTSEGLVVHTGDFKFDLTPVNNQAADLAKMALIGEKGVICLLSDSTNAEIPGFTGSERKVGEGIQEVFQKAKGRIIVSTFATNIHRIQQVMNAASSFKRKLAVIGQTLETVLRISSDLGYLDVPDNLLIGQNEIERYPYEQIAILSAGSQGEPMSALTRMAYSSHPVVDIVPGDTVIIAGSPFPGNEKDLAKTIDQLTKKGAYVIYGAKIHVSGHGCQDELKLMLNLMKPKYFIPIHGEYRMLRQHALLAQQVGTPPENIFIIDNGDTVEISEGRARYGSRIHAGNVLIDGLGVGDVGNIVLRDRKLLSQDGILIAVVTLSKQTGAILSGPDIVSRGFVYVRESEQLIVNATAIVTQALKKCMDENINDWTSIKNGIRDQLARFLYEQTKRKPMILPIIMEV